MLSYSQLNSYRTRPHIESWTADIGSEAQLTKWGSVLCRAAEKNIPCGSAVADLGAGPQAVIMRQLIKSGVQANWLAVEPNYSVKGPSGLTVVRGDLRALSKNSLDVILFNPPVIPDRYLNSFLPHYYMFLAGTNWTEALDDVLVESPRCLRRNGRLIIICPTFLQPPLLFQENPFVLEFCYESIISFVSRAPLRNKQTTEQLISDIRERSDASTQAWENMGIPNLSDAFAVVAIEIRYS